MDSGDLSFLCFPYIDLEEVPLREVILYFKRIVFLRPSFWVPSALTERLQTEGIVESKAPIQLDLDNVMIRRMLKEFESLVALYQDSGYLEYLKHGTIPFEDDEQCRQIISEIRRYEQHGRSDKTSEEGAIDCLRGQLLLQLAQELESQRRELLGLYQEVREKEEYVAHSLREDIEEAMGNRGAFTPAEGQISDALKPDEDDFLIAERLGAWNEMYQRIDGEEFLIFTDNRYVLQVLTDGLEDSEEEELPDHKIEELAILTLPAFRSGPIEEYMKAREAIMRLPEWRGFEKELFQFISSINKRSWDKGTRRDLLSAGHGLSKSAVEILTDSIIEGVHEQTRLVLDPSKTIILRIFAIPGRKPEKVLNRHWRGRSPSLEKSPGNGSFLLVDHGGAIAHEV